MNGAAEQKGAGRPGHRRAVVSWVGPAVLALLAAGCGGRHTGPGDGDADVELDGDVGTDGDADADPDDADEPGQDSGEGDTDLDRDDEPDGDVAPRGPTWVRSMPALTGVAPLPGGDMVVAWPNGLARLDATGEVVWSRTYGGSAYSWFMVDTSPGGRVFAAAQEYLGPERTTWLAELGEHGDVISQQGLGPQVIAVRMQPLADGGFVAAGLDADREPEVVRISPDEGILWRRRITRRHAVTQDVYHVLGDFMGDSLYLVTKYEGEWGVVVTSLDLNGLPLWSRSVLVTGENVFQTAVVTGDGGIVLVGDEAARLVKLDADGALEWAVAVGRYEEGFECMPFCESDLARSAATGPGGELLAVGMASGWDGAETYNDMLAVLVDADGASLWQTAIRGPGRTLDTMARFAAGLDDGRWAIYGELTGTERDHWLAVLGSDGRLDRRCSAVASLSHASTSYDPNVRVVDDLIIEEGSAELEDLSLEAEDVPFESEPVCP